MHGMFTLGVPAWELVCRAAIVYVALLILLRLSGKHTVGELSIFDLIVVIVIGSAVRTALLGNDKSVLGGLLVVTVLLLLTSARFCPRASARRSMCSMASRCWLPATAWCSTTC